MARPTDDKKEHTIILRINEELYGEITRASERNETTVSECVRKILTDEFCNTKKKEREKSVLQNAISEETYKDLTRMCQLSGYTVEKFIEYIVKMFNEGQIYVDGVLLKARSKYDIGRLEDVCHRRNYDPQDIIDKITDKLIKGY